MCTLIASVDQVIICSARRQKSRVGLGTPALHPMIMAEIVVIHRRHAGRVASVVVGVIDRDGPQYFGRPPRGREARWLIGQNHGGPIKDRGQGEGGAVKVWA